MVADGLFSIMDAGPLHDITGVTGQPCVGGGGGGGSLSISLLCPLRELRVSLSKPADNRPRTRGGNFCEHAENLLNSGLSAGHGRARLVESGGFPGCAIAAERTSQCDSRRL